MFYIPRRQNTSLEDRYPSPSKVQRVQHNVFTWTTTLTAQSSVFTDKTFPRHSMISLVPSKEIPASVFSGISVGFSSRSWTCQSHLAVTWRYFISFTRSITMSTETQHLAATTDKRSFYWDLRVGDSFRDFTSRTTPGDLTRTCTPNWCCDARLRIHMIVGEWCWYFGWVSFGVAVGLRPC